MGGCASVDKMIPKFNLLPVRAVKSYTIGQTHIELYDEDPIKCQIENVVIPIFEGGVFDSALFAIPADEKAKVEAVISQLLAGAVGDRLKSGEVVLVPVDGKFSDEPYKSLKNIIFVPIPNSPSFARERLPNVLLEIVKRTDEGKLSAILIPRLTKPGQIGTADTEIASITAKTFQSRFVRQPTPGEHVLQKLAFGTSDKKYLVDLQRAFNEATGLNEKVPDAGEGGFNMPMVGNVNVPGVDTVKNMFKF